MLTHLDERDFACAPQVEKPAPLLLHSQDDWPGTSSDAQYSRVLVTPGLGTGYRPSLPTIKGAGESSFR